MALYGKVILGRLVGWCDDWHLAFSSPFLIDATPSQVARL
jgi:hypothetical protein